MVREVRVVEGSVEHLENTVYGILYWSQKGTVGQKPNPTVTHHVAPRLKAEVGRADSLLLRERRLRVHRHLRVR